MGESYNGGFNNGFALLVVLFILLIIVGASYFNN
ncbi:YjcZ family sporulation protein [Robertmurraya sp.]